MTLETLYKWAMASSEDGNISATENKMNVHVFFVWNTEFFFYFSFVQL